MELYLKVKPNKRFNKVEKTGNEWQILLKAPPIDGKANEGLINYLSKVLGLPKSKIILKKGETSRIKCVEILAEEEFVKYKLNEALKE